MTRDMSSESGEVRTLEGIDEPVHTIKYIKAIQVPTLEQNFMAIQVGGTKKYMPWKDPKSYGDEMSASKRYILTKLLSFPSARV